MAGSHEVRGSIPLGSTTDSRGARRRRRAPLFYSRGGRAHWGLWDEKRVRFWALARAGAHFLWGKPPESTFPPGRKACPAIGAFPGRMGKSTAKGRRSREDAADNAERPSRGGARGAGRRARRAPGGGGLPMRRHRAPVAAVPPRYVAEVGLYARFPVHVQLPDHAAAHGRLLPKDLDLLGSSVGPRAVVELVKMRWRDWRAYGGANGQSALAEMAVFAVAPATAPGSRAAAWRSWPAATSARCSLASPRSGLVVETPPQGWAARARR